MTWRGGARARRPRRRARTPVTAHAEADLRSERGRAPRRAGGARGVGPRRQAPRARRARHRRRRRRAARAPRASGSTTWRRDRPREGGRSSSPLPAPGEQRRARQRDSERDAQREGGPRAGEADRDRAEHRRADGDAREQRCAGRGPAACRRRRWRGPTGRRCASPASAAGDPRGRGGRRARPASGPAPAAPRRGRPAARRSGAGREGRRAPRRRPGSRRARRGRAAAPPGRRRSPSPPGGRWWPRRTPGRAGRPGPAARRACPARTRTRRSGAAALLTFGSTRVRRPDAEQRDHGVEAVEDHRLVAATTTVRPASQGSMAGAEPRRGGGSSAAVGLVEQEHRARGATGRGRGPHAGARPSSA